MKLLFYCAIAVMALSMNTCAGQTYVAEGYFVVDFKAVEIYIHEIQGTDSYENKQAQAIVRVLQDVNYIVSETNKLFSSLNANGLNIQLRVRGLNILNTSLFPEGALQNGTVISDRIAQQLFSDWLRQQAAYSTYRFDFTLLWTGYDLYGPSGIYTTAIANIGKICDPILATSVVEFSATYGTVLTTAHTIALSFGASNDGAASDQIMAVTNSPLHKRRWSFSECSATDIKEFFSLITPVCLQTTNPASTTPATSWATYNGLLFDHNAICKRSIKDSSSYACLSSNLYNNLTAKGDQLCQTIYCHLPGTNLCQTTYTSDGLICDYRKRCDKGSCVTDTSAASANVDSECVLGDQEALFFPNIPFSGTCQQFIAQEGKSMCYNSVIKDVCCVTCKSYKNGATGCEYGDKNDMCPLLPLSTSCAPQNRAVCCQTCRGAPRKRSAGEDLLGGYLLKDDSHKAAQVLEEFKPEFDDVSKKVLSA